MDHERLDELVMSSFSPEDGIFIYKELKRAVQAFIMDGEMQILYMSAIIWVPQVEINWHIFRKEMDSVDESDLRVLMFVGIIPTIVIECTSF
jgi:hypothetical protein